MVPYQDVEDPAVSEELRAACATAMHVVLPDGTVIRGGRAVLHVFGVLGYPMTGVLGSPPLIWAVEIGYGWVARNRITASKFFFRHDYDADTGPEDKTDASSESS